MFCTECCGDVDLVEKSGNVEVYRCRNYGHRFKLVLKEAWRWLKKPFRTEVTASAAGNYRLPLGLSHE